MTDSEVIEFYDIIQTKYYSLYDLRRWFLNRFTTALSQALYTYSDVDSILSYLEDDFRCYDRAGTNNYFRAEDVKILIALLFTRRVVPDKYISSTVTESGYVNKRKGELLKKLYNE